MKKLVMIIMVAALVALPTMAQDWKSTSAMQGSGSTYSPQVTEVGATSVAGEATPTESYSPAKAPSGPRKTLGGGNSPETGQGPSPIGDAIIPLLLMSFVFCGVIALRRKRNAINN